MSKGEKLTELRRSNAPGPHQDKRTKRNRTKSAQKRTAIRESQE